MYKQTLLLLSPGVVPEPHPGRKLLQVIGSVHGACTQMGFYYHYIDYVTIQKQAVNSFSEFSAHFKKSLL